MKNIDNIRKKIKKEMFGEWIPPIIDDLPKLANNQETQWSK